MPWAYYTLTIRACKWFGQRCIDVGEKFEVDLCDAVGCEVGNHTIDQEIIFYGDDDTHFNYWEYHYGYDVDATDEEIAEYKQQQRQQNDDYDEDEEEGTYAPGEDPDEDEDGNYRYHNYYRNQYAYKRQYRQDQKEEKGYNVSRTLNEFVSQGTKLSLVFTFIPYTGPSYDRTNTWNRTTVKNYGTRYSYDNIKCTLPLKVVSDDFDFELWKQSARYRSRETIYTISTTVAFVGLLGLSVWGMKKRRLVCHWDCMGDAKAEQDGNSILDDDAKTTDFVLADRCGPNSGQPV